MPRYLALYTADQSGPPTPEHMQKMGELMQRQQQARKLVATGGLMKKETHGFRLRQKNGAVTLEEGGADWARANGWAILQANSREELIGDIKEFLAAAGDGVSEVVEIFEPPPPS
jgi:hypothetical protein